MALIQPTLWLENSVDHHAQAYRLLLQMQTAGAAGVWPNSTPVTETTGAEMKVRIKGGNHFLIRRTAALHNGSSHVYNDADVDRDIDPADGLQDRYDLVIARINDSAIAGTPNTDDGTLEVVTGVVGAGVPPAAPDDALAVASVRVRAGTSSIEDGEGDIVTVAAPVSAAPFVCTSTTRPVNAVKGQIITEVDTGLQLRWTGTGWRYLPGQVLAQAKITTTTNGVTPGPLPGYSVTFDSLGHPVEVIGRTHLQNTGSAGFVILELREGGVGIEGPFSQGHYQAVSLHTVTDSVFMTPAPGEHTYALRFLSGPANVNQLCSATRRGQLTVISA